MSEVNDYSSLKLEGARPASQTLGELEELIASLIQKSSEALLFEKTKPSTLTNSMRDIIDKLAHIIEYMYPDLTKDQLRRQSDFVLDEILELETLFLSDIDAALTNDPATSDPLEVIYCYPGFKATSYHRIAHIFYKKKFPLLPRFIAEQAHRQTGIDIHPGAQIGDYFFIDHGTGVVVGETCIIGSKVTLYQGVTLGAKRFDRDDTGIVIKGNARHPIIGDSVTIYSGATILGRITVGQGSIIGGNVWLTEDVAPNSRVSQQHFDKRKK